MKIKFISFFLFLSLSTEAQIADLNKLSKGKLYSSDEIKDSNNNIKGYFLLFETDKVAKETYDLEYVVLDENLTKVTNGTITEMKFESFLIDAANVNVSAELYKDKLLLEFSDNFQSMKAYRRYRLLDIKTNALSNPFIFNKDKMVMNPVFDRKMKNYADNESQEMHFFEGVGLVVNSSWTDKKAGRTEKYMAHYDENFNQVWKCVYEDMSIPGKIQKRPEYVKSDKDVIVMFSHNTKQGTWSTNNFSIFFIDSKTGKLLNQFEFPSMDKFAYKIVDCKMKDEQIFLFGNQSKKSQYGNTNDTENIGLFKYGFNKSDAKLTESQYLSWESMVEKLPVNKLGNVKNEGFMFVHNMLSLEDDSVIVVTETFMQVPITTNNMYFFKLTKDFKLEEVFEVSKFRNKFPNTSGHSDEIKKYGLFDFIDYQDLGDDQFLFFLNDNEKKSRNRRKSTLYGIVSYTDGKFKRQTLDLKTETSSIVALNAKKGYLVLVENFDDPHKSNEFRLEKINY